MDLESGLFRMLDEALVAYLDRSPDRATLRLDWTPERVEARMTATRDRRRPRRAGARGAARRQGPPPALAAMMEDRRAAARDAVEAARKEAIVAMPPTTWREIQGRAATIGVTVELLVEGAELHLVADIPADAEGVSVRRPRPTARSGPRRVRPDPRPHRGLHGAHPRRVRRHRRRHPRTPSGRPSTRPPAAR